MMFLKSYKSFASVPQNSGNLSFVATGMSLTQQVCADIERQLQGIPTPGGKEELVVNIQQEAENRAGSENRLRVPKQQGQERGGALALYNRAGGGSSDCPVALHGSDENCCYDFNTASFAAFATLNFNTVFAGI